jgi:hypothetical protein
MIDTNPLNLRCDICNANMVMEKDGDKATFKCTECEQIHILGRSGSHSFRILHRMFPSVKSILDFPDEQRKEYIDDWRDKQLFSNMANLLAGFVTEVKFKVINDNIEDAVEKHWKDYPLKVSWWDRLIRRGK